MNRDTRKRQDGVHEMVFTMQSASERDDWMKYFPHPIPPHHQAVIRWENDMTVVMSVEARADAASQAAENVTVNLSALSEPELQQRAAEKGLPTKGKSKGQLVGALAEKK